MSAGPRLSGRLFAVLAVAAVVRCAYVLAYPQLPLADDAASYQQEAEAFVVGTPGPSSWAARFNKGPVYPLFLSTVYRMSGTNPAAARLAQALLGVGVVALLYAVGAAAFHERLGLIAAILGALYPPFISYTGLLLTETLSTALLLAFCWTAVRAWQRPSALGWWAAAGAAGAVAALHRKDFLMVLGATVLLLAWWRAGWRPLAVMICAAGALLGPWTVQVHRATGQWTLAASPTAGQVLWLAVVDTGEREWDTSAPHMREYERLTAGLPPLEADRRLRDEAWRRVRRDPLSYLARCGRRFAGFWLGGHSNTFRGFEDSLASTLGRGDYARAAVKLALVGVNLTIIGLAVLGAHLAYHSGLADPHIVILLAAPIVVKAALHAALFAALRYQVPMMGPMLVLAAFAIWHARGLARDVVPG
jgi:4-amino-4-deoxy-L-arabinose transferase-like glycosyltransferase